MSTAYRALLERSEPLTDTTRCGYCRLPFGRSPFGRGSFHVDHIIPRSRAKQLTNTIENLTWACVRCNQVKGCHTTGCDSVLEKLESLFNPRKQPWEGHFWGAPDGKIYGITGVGRATGGRLRFNEEATVVLHRSEGYSGGWWPG